jgi:hypothetical protein
MRRRRTARQWDDRERAGVWKMETITGHVVLDEDVAKVVEFMERRVPANRLMEVAQSLPAIARVLWSEDRCATTYKEPLSRGTQ